jgi:nitrile hydratase accessory protein
VSEQRLASPAIAEMSGACALPRHSGELVFSEDWERRAFAIAVSLAERGHFAWAEFQRQLIASISQAEQRDPRSPRHDYYESWLIALEALLQRKRLAGD